MTGNNKHRMKDEARQSIMALIIKRVIIVYACF